MSGDGPRHRFSQAGTLGEWILGGISTFTVLAIAAVLVHQGLTRDPEGAAVQVRVDRVRQAADSLWVVEFWAENTGGAPALNVTVRGRLGAGEPPVAEATTTLDLVPEGARRRGGLQFRSDPAAHPLELRATGWTRP